MYLVAHYQDSKGNWETIEGETLEEMAAQLPEDYDVGSIEVHDDREIRGWIRRNGGWQWAR